MEGFLIILMMIIIGAMIGGLTNSLAIKMLFRPYQPIYIGNWKIPLTPGLIPKRRQELARQLGKMVVDHLLTPEGIKRKLRQPEFQRQLTTWGQEELTRLLDQEISLKEALAKLGIYINEDQLREKIENWTKTEYQQFMLKRRSSSLKELVSEQWLTSSNHQINQLTNYIQKQIVTNLETDAAKTKIGQLIESYLEGKGFLGNMISSFIGNDGLTDQIHPVLVDYARSPDVNELIGQLVQKEFDHLLNQPLGTMEDKIGAQTIANAIGTFTAKILPLEKWFGTSVNEWSTPIKPQLLDHILPTIITRALAVIEMRLEVAMEKFELEEIVEREVESFPIERVEQLVLNISRKEFKLITYLGALLGGIIGLIQGLIVLLIG